MNVQRIECTTSSQRQYGICLTLPTAVINIASTLGQHHVSMDSRCYLKEWFVKRFVDSKKSAVSDSILLFVEKLYLDGPYNKIFTILSSQ